MKFFISLRSELVKSRGTIVWYLCLITAVLTPIYSILLSIQPDKIAELKKDPWNVFLTGESGGPFNVLILPLFLVLICTLLGQLEYRNHTWKQVYVSPQPLLNIFLSKFLIIQLLLLGVIFLSMLLQMVSLAGIHYFKIDLNLFEHSLNWDELFIYNGRIYITLLSISAFQFWLGLRLKNFMAPIVIGLCLWLGGIMMLEEYAWNNDTIYPYIYPMRNFYPKTPEERTTILWASTGYTSLFLVLGFLNFKIRKIRN